MDNNNGVTVSTVGDTLDLFSADSLLAGTPIMSQVLILQGTLSRGTDGEFINYDDMVFRIQEEVDGLQSLALELDIASGTEGAYQRQLLHALEKINDDCDRVLRKVIKLKSRLINAKSLMTNKCSQFTAFYSLAVPAAIQASGLKHKFSMSHIKEMAESEFSRLMDNLDNAAPSMINELQILEDEVKIHKKTQAEKYQLGKDQVNAAWTSIQGNGSGGISLDDDPGMLLRSSSKFPLDEDSDEIPAYVSRNSKEVRVAANPSLEPRTKPGLKPLIDPIKAARLQIEDEAEDAEFIRDPKPKPEEPYDENCLLDTNCIHCGERQFNTPHGVTCKNGHGGAEGVSREIKGTFFKKGDPKPITPIVDDDSLIGIPTASIAESGSSIVSRIEKPRIVVFTPTSPPAQPPIQWSQPEWSESRILELSEDDSDGIVAASPETLEGEPIEDAEPLAAPAPTSPRKKPMLLEDEDVL